MWYTWLAPASGTVELSTYGSTFDTLLAVYTGTSLSNLVEIVSNDDDENNDPGASANRFFASRVNFNALAGTAYQIALDGFDGAEGSYLLSVAITDRDFRTTYDHWDRRIEFTVRQSGAYAGGVVFMNDQWNIDGAVAPPVGP